MSEITRTCETIKLSSKALNIIRAYLIQDGAYRNELDIKSYQYLFKIENEEKARAELLYGTRELRNVTINYKSEEMELDATLLSGLITRKDRFELDFSLNLSPPESNEDMLVKASLADKTVALISLKPLD